MTLSFTGRKRLRKYFGKMVEVAQMPNLIEVQMTSYDQFLQVVKPEGGRKDEGLQAVFASVFPIQDFSESSRLEYVDYYFEEPKYDVEECQQRSMTYAAPLKVTLRLIVFDVDQETGAKSVKDIKEQDVYMGDVPFMTENGTFIVNGTERVIVSQMHRSPGVFFDHDKGKTHSSGKLLFAARVIPYRGSWLDFEFDAKDIIHVRIDRRRKLPATTLLYALGLDQEQILDYFYGKISFKRQKDGSWTTPLEPGWMKNAKTNSEWKNAKTGEVLAEAGTKITQRSLRKWQEDGIKQISLSADELIGRYSALDMVNPETGEIYRRSRRRADRRRTLDQLGEAGFDEIDVINVDGITIGAYIRNTMAVDKNHSREQALIDIYRVMRPGEPPTLDTAETLFGQLFFDSERYDLSSVGRVKMNMRLGLDAPDTDAHPAQGRHPGHRQGAGRTARRPRRNRRHRQSRQPPRAFGRRADGEPVPHRPAAHGARDQGADERGRYRHRHAARSDQRQAGGRGGARVLRLVAAFAVHGPDQSAVGSDPQAAHVGARAGRPDARTRRLRSARRASDALRPHLPDRNAGRPEHRPDQFAGDLCARQQIRLHRKPVPARAQQARHRRGRLSLGDGRGEVHHRPGQRDDRRPRTHHRRTRLLPQGRQLRDDDAGPGGIHRRVAEAACFGGRGAGSVPGERRRQPRA